MGTLLLGIVCLVGCGGSKGPVNHYDFEGEGRLVFDRVGWNDGFVVGGAMLVGKGAITLDGDDDFVDLPNGLISGYRSATIELVFQAHELVGAWPRVFSFGSTMEGEINRAGKTGSKGGRYLELTLRDADSNTQCLIYRYREGPHHTVEAIAERSITDTNVHHIAVVFDEAERSLSYFLDGKSSCRIEDVPAGLENLSDVNVWLGRSQWTNDPTPRATFYACRIYDRALSAAEIRDLAQKQKLK